MATTDFADGRETAGWHARLVKSNEQGRRSGGQEERTCSTIADKLLSNPLFQLGEAEGALALDPVTLQARHGLRQPRRRRADPFRPSRSPDRAGGFRIHFP